MTDLEENFYQHGIDYSSIGFYDSPEFIKIERFNPDFLEYYAQYVREKDFSQQYIEKAKCEIPFIAKILNNELQKDGRLGACIDISIVLSRILEKEGYWNYLTKGSLTMKFPSDSGIKTKYFWTVDTEEIQSGHSWVVAPPFNVIDLALKQQAYKEQELKYLPNLICNTSNKQVEIQEIDIISPEASLIMHSQGIVENKLDYVKDGFSNFIGIFPPILIEIDNTSLKYSTIAISAPDEPLERVRTLKLSGKYGIDIYNDIVKPELLEYRKTAFLKY